MRTYKEKIRDFLYGQHLASTIINALVFRLRYAAILRGIEHSHGAKNKTFLKKYYSTDNSETRMNIEIARLEPDVEIISPSGDLTKLEIKATDCDTIEEFFRSSSFGFQSVLDVTEHYPTTRFLFVNLRQQKITSISGPRIDPLNIDTQRQNWNEPWHWIEGLDTELQFNYWAENFIFDPLCLSAEKIISKLRQSSNKSDIRNLISEF